jgi:hypothetical protein
VVATSTIQRSEIRLNMLIQRVWQRPVAFMLLATGAALLANQSVTSTGPSLLFGNLGVSPGSAVTGFPSGSVIPPGTQHLGDPMAL